MNLFEELIQELGTILTTPLHANKGSFCTLNIQGFFKVHLELEPAYDRILMASFLCDLPPGKFREDVFKEALKSNSSPSSLGVLAYSEKNNQLAFFLYLPASTSPQKLADILSQFIEKGKTWKTATETGQMHLIQQESGSSFPSPLKL